MPISARRAALTTQPQQPTAEEVPPLRTPQVRVLAALMPEDPSARRFRWPLLTRAKLGVGAGYTAISGSVTRALDGIRPGSSSGAAHLGLLALGHVEVLILDIDGVKEINYRITASGIAAYRRWLAENGGIPPVRNAETCTNTKRGYKRGEWKQGADKYKGKLT